MGSERDAAGHCGGQELGLGRKLGGGLVSKQSGDGNADEGVQSVPDKVESRNLIGKELNEKKSLCGAYHPPIFQNVKVWRKREDAVVADEAQSRDGGVDIQSGGEARADDHSHDLGIAKVHHQWDALCLTNEG